MRIMLQDNILHPILLLTTRESVFFSCNSLYVTSISY